MRFLRLALLVSLLVALSSSAAELSMAWVWRDRDTVAPGDAFWELTDNNGSHAVQLTEYDNNTKVWVAIASAWDDDEESGPIAHEYTDLTEDPQQSIIRASHEEYDIGTVSITMNSVTKVSCFHDYNPDRSRAACTTGFSITGGTQWVHQKGLYQSNYENPHGHTAAVLFEGNLHGVAVLEEEYMTDDLWGALETRYTEDGGRTWVHGFPVVDWSTPPIFHEHVLGGEGSHGAQRILGSQ